MRPTSKQAAVFTCWILAAGCSGEGLATDSGSAGQSTGEVASDCRGPGRYQAGKEGSYRPCCSGLREVFYTKLATAEGGARICISPELRIYACVQGRCGDGVCEVGEADACGCVADCPSAAWGDVPTGEVGGEPPVVEPRGEEPAPSQDASPTWDGGAGVGKDGGVAGNPDTTITTALPACRKPVVCYPINQASLCHGVVLKTITFSFDPTDPRWAANYRTCVEYSANLIRPTECDWFCDSVVQTDATLKVSTGFGAASIACAQPEQPTITVEYSTIRCEPGM